MVRDPRASICSGLYGMENENLWYWIRMWKESVNAILEHNLFTIQYEDLIENPPMIQAWLNHYGIKTNEFNADFPHNLSSYGKKGKGFYKDNKKWQIYLSGKQIKAIEKETKEERKVFGYGY